MIKKLMGLLFLMTTPLQACPFCASNLAGNGAGFSLGINVTVFVMLGTLGSLAGFIIYQIIQQEKKPKS
jgi:hypothetical protein